MKAFAGATTFYAIAPLAKQQPKYKPFNPLLIFIPKLVVSPPHSSSAIRKWTCSHYSKSKGFKIKAKARAEADKEDEKKFVQVKILLQKECMFGEKFSVVGTNECLGSWDPQAAVPMIWSPGHLWTTPLLDIPVGKRIYFKFILTNKLGEIQWQPGPDRIFETWDTTATIVVSEDWDSFHPQTITEEATEGEFAETMIETLDPIGDGTAEVLVSGTDEKGGGEVISGVPVLVPGLTKAFHADCSVEEDVGSDRNSLVSVMVPEPNAEEEEEEDEEEEEEDEEEENSSYVEDAINMPTGHKSLVKEEEEEEDNSSYLEDAVDTPTDHTSLGDEEEDSSSYVDDAVDTPTNHRSLVDEEEETSTSAEMSVANEEESPIATELIENGDHAASSELNCNEEELLNSGNGKSDISVLQNDFDWGRKALSKLIWSLGLKDE